MALAINEQEGGVSIRLRVIPRASANAIGGARGDSVVVKLTAPPIDGKANKALAKFLAKRLGIAVSSVSIVSGLTSRDKTVLIKGLPKGEILDKLGLQDAT